MDPGSELYKLLVASIRDYAIFLLDSKGFVRSWNPGAEQIKGYTADEIIGKHFSIFYLHEDVARNHPEAELKSAQMDGRYEEEGWRVRKDGSKFWASVLITALRDEKGQLVGYAKVTRDLGKKRAEEEARTTQSEKQLKLIADALPSLIGYVDTEYRYRFANAAYKNWFGIAASEVLGKTFKELFGSRPEPLETIVPHAEKAFAGEPQSFEAELEYPAKGRRYIQATYIPDRTSEGAVKGVIILVNDLTERRRSERAEQFLNEITIPLSATLDYHKVMKVAAQACVPTIADFCIVDLLPSEGKPAMREVGMAPPVEETLLSFITRHIPSRDYPSYPPARAAFTGESVLVRNLAESNWNGFKRSTEQYKNVRKYELRSVISVPLVARGEILGAFTIMTAKSRRTYDDKDLTLAREIARRISLSIDNSQLLEKAKEAIEARDLFLSIASHELKSPITTMKIQSQMLSRKIAKGDPNAFKPAEVAQLASQTDRSLNRLTRLVEDMLDISRIQTGKLAMNVESVELSSLVKEVVDRVAGELKTAKIDIQFKGAENAVVKGDRVRIEQVVTNIVNNAIRYAPGKPMDIEIKVVNGKVCASFKDRGPGIPSEHQERIFERFQRMVSEPTGPGLGLGLYIVRQILDAHGGSIRLESEQGKGSTFTIEFPLLQEHDASKVAIA